MLLERLQQQETVAAAADKNRFDGDIPREETANRNAGRGTSSYLTR